ncbi:MAG TPA: SGNH/GDSL hydrolase family protein [Haliangium sp.]|nr:SGNH/GDSL hydrolase family protein [Haliangium sp.]
MKTFARTLLAALVASLMTAQVAVAAPQLAPNRLSSIGDSISEAINAEWFNPFEITTRNHWASWASGFHGFWESLLGKTNVWSFNQRITANFGRFGRANFMEARGGADSYDLAQQANQAVSHGASFVTMFMGHNDVCQSSFADIPTDAEFEANWRASLNILKNGLPAGATVYVASIVDIYRLYQLGQEKKALGIVDCSTIWLAALFEMFPCGTMLSPANSEADRQFTRSRNIAFNQILQDLVAEYGQSDPNHYYHFSDATFKYQFVPSQVSNFDCFHPSAVGQRDLSRLLWSAGPFSSFQR